MGYCGLWNELWVNFPREREMYSEKWEVKCKNSVISIKNFDPNVEWYQMLHVLCAQAQKRTSGNSTLTFRIVKEENGHTSKVIIHFIQKDHFKYMTLFRVVVSPKVIAQCSYQTLHFTVAELKQMIKCCYSDNNTHSYMFPSCLHLYILLVYHFGSL